MADFCQQCSIAMFDKDFGDLAGVSTAEDTALGNYAWVLCEGCGMTHVDHAGRCIAPGCLENHNVPA